MIICGVVVSGSCYPLVLGSCYHLSSHPLKTFAARRRGRLGLRIRAPALHADHLAVLGGGSPRPRPSFSFPSSRKGHHSLNWGQSDAKAQVVAPAVGFAPASASRTGVPVPRAPTKDAN